MALAALIHLKCSTPSGLDRHRRGQAFRPHEHSQNAHGALARVAAVVGDRHGFENGVASVINSRLLTRIADRQFAFENVAKYRHAVRVPAGLFTGYHIENYGCYFGRRTGRIGYGLTRNCLRCRNERNKPRLSLPSADQTTRGHAKSSCKSGAYSDAYGYGSEPN